MDDLPRYKVYTVYIYFLQDLSTAVGQYRRSQHDICYIQSSKTHIKLSAVFFWSSAKIRSWFSSEVLSGIFIKEIKEQGSIFIWDPPFKSSLLHLICINYTISHKAFVVLSFNVWLMSDFPSDFFGSWFGSSRAIWPKLSSTYIPKFT